MDFYYKNKYKKYLLKLFLALFCVLFATGILNFFVNPYNIFQVPTCKLTYLKPEAKLQERLTKFIGLKFDKRKIDTVFLGTSRADYAIDKDYYKQLTGKEAENMAMGGMIIEEYQDVLDLILKIHPEIKNVYLSADFIMFGGNSVFDELSKAKLNTDKNLTSSEICSALFSITGLRDSAWTVIKNILGIKTKMYMPNGLRYPTENENFEESIAASIVEYSKKYENFEYNPEKLNTIRFLKEYCDNRGINLIIFVMPTHIVDMQLMQYENVYDDFLAWKQDLSYIVPFYYDFQYPCNITNEKFSADMEYFFEISHATPVTGNLILDELVSDNLSFGRFYSSDYSYVFNKSDRDELFLLADDEKERTLFLDKVWRKVKNAV